MDPEAVELERRHVHSVYENTAPYFTDLQSKAWPRVRQFLQDQKPGSLVADIGNPYFWFFAMCGRALMYPFTHTLFTHVSYSF